MWENTVFQYKYFFLGRRPLTPIWTNYSNFTAKYYIMFFPELIFNFPTTLHEKFSKSLGTHFMACVDLIVELNAVSVQKKSSMLTEQFLQN